MLQIRLLLMPLRQYYKLTLAIQMLMVNGLLRPHRHYMLVGLHRLRHYLPSLKLAILVAGLLHLLVLLPLLIILVLHLLRLRTLHYMGYAYSRDQTSRILAHHLVRRR